MSFETADARRSALRGPALSRIGGWLAAAAGFATAVLILRAPPAAPAPTIMVAIATGVLVAWIAWQDSRTFTIPDSAVLALASIAAAWRWSEWRWSGVAQLGDASLSSALAIGLDAALPGAVLLAFREIYFRRKGRDGIGFGDVKLAAAGGVLVGAVGFSWALFAASLGGLLFVGATRLSPKSHAKSFVGSDKLAFGAILAPAIWVVWIVQQMALVSPALG